MTNKNLRAVPTRSSLSSKTQLPSSSLRPLFDVSVGFDDMLNRVFDDLLPQTTHKNTSFPPYNIRKQDRGVHVIEMALAGYKKDDLEVTLHPNNTLEISALGSTETEDEKESYIYRGVAARSFSRSFILAEGVEVTSVQFVDGMLLVYLEAKEPEKFEPQKLEIL